MPHSLYLGSGIVQARLYAYSPESYKADSAAAAVLASSDSGHSSLSIKLRRPTPPIKTIKSSLRYSITELAISLSTLALFTNSAILILAGASLSNHPEADGADIFTIHDLLSSTVAPIAGTVFALALLLSGLSAGIVCTLAGQMISEGALHWTLRPWLRRLVTRSISITPAIIIAGAVGRPGLSAALNASQVVLSVILPVVSAPVIWFTCRAQYMMVYPEATALQPLSSSSIDLPGRAVERPSADAGSRSASVLAPRPALTRAKTSSRFLIRRITRPNRASEPAAAVMAAAAASATPSPVGGQVGVNMRNGWLTTTVAVLVWLLLAVMNVALLVLLGLGRA